MGLEGAFFGKKDHLITRQWLLSPWLSVLRKRMGLALQGLIFLGSLASPAWSNSSIPRFIAIKDREDITRILGAKKRPPFLGDESSVNRLKALFPEVKIHPQVPASRALAPEVGRIMQAVPPLNVKCIISIHSIIDAISI